MKSYEYTKANRLIEPHKYMYAPFNGHDFLHSYFLDRKVCLERFSVMDLSNAPESLDYTLTAMASIKLRRQLKGSPSVALEWFNNLNCLNEFRGDPKDIDKGNEIQRMVNILTSMKIDDPINTQDLICGIIASIVMDMPETLTKVWLDRLVQRFEVTKKLFESYQPGLRKGVGSTDVVRLYWLFALALCLFYVESRHIKFLSTLLKVSDLLCSLPDGLLLGQIPQQGMSVILATEAGCIYELAYKRGVLFDFE
ncbi:MAG: hypothetical protein ABGY11_11325 [Candidatus Thioglobus sp.]